MFLGIEIGGTKLQLGIGSGDGRLAAFQRLPVDVGAGGEGIRRQILATVPALLQSAKLKPSELKAVAFGFGGPVDDTTRRVITSHQVSGWDDFPLAEWAEKELGWPAVLGNDSNVAGLAEAVLGAGKGLSPIFYTNLGSGIGGALIVNGEMYRGCGKGAVEIGHLWMDYEAESPVFFPREPEWRIVEHCSSGWAITCEAQKVFGPNPALNAEQVGRMAMAGDSRAVGVLQKSRRRFAIALSHVIALFCPRRIVIGGGVSLIGEELLFKPLREEVSRIAFEPFADCYDIVPAALGEEVVIHGALVLAKKRLG